MKKLAVLAAVIFMVIAVPTGAIGATEYKLINSKNLDFGPHKKHLGAKRTQYDIQVARDTEDNEITAILYQAVKDLTEKRKVDALVVRLYLIDTNLPYAMAYWAPYGDWGKAEKGKPASVFKVSIETYKEKRPTDSIKVEKEGLSGQERIKIYREIGAAESKARRNAERKHPDDIMKQIDYQDMLNKKYEKEICAKYKITHDQYLQIMVEGVINNWP